MLNQKFFNAFIFLALVVCFVLQFTINNDEAAKNRIASLAANIQCADLVCPAGPTGPEGPQGPTGAMGPRGFNGLTITGPKGEKGDKGDKGEKGDTGDKGDKGDTGDQGKAGIDGEITRSELETSLASMSGILTNLINTNNDSANTGFSDLSTNITRIGNDLSALKVDVKEGTGYVAKNYYNTSYIQKNIPTIDTLKLYVPYTDFNPQMSGMSGYFERKLNNYYNKDDINTNYYTIPQIDVSLSGINRRLNSISTDMSGPAGYINTNFYTKDSVNSLFTNTEGTYMKDKSKIESSLSAMSGYMNTKLYDEARLNNYLKTSLAGPYYDDKQLFNNTLQSLSGTVSQLSSNLNSNYYDKTTSDGRYVQQPTYNQKMNTLDSSINTLTTNFNNYTQQSGTADLKYAFKSDLNNYMNTGTLYNTFLTQLEANGYYTKVDADGKFLPKGTNLYQTTVDANTGYNNLMSQISNVYTSSTGISGLQSQINDRVTLATFNSGTGTLNKTINDSITGMSGYVDTNFLLKSAAETTYLTQTGASGTYTKITDYTTKTNSLQTAIDGLTGPNGSIKTLQTQIDNATGSTGPTGILGLLNRINILYTGTTGISGIKDTLNIIDGSTGTTGSIRNLQSQISAATGTGPTGIGGILQMINTIYTGTTGISGLRDRIYEITGPTGSIPNLQSQINGITGFNTTEFIDVSNDPYRLSVGLINTVLTPKQYSIHYFELNPPDNKPPLKMKRNIINEIIDISNFPIKPPFTSTIMGPNKKILLQTYLIGNVPSSGGFQTGQQLPYQVAINLNTGQTKTRKAKETSVTEWEEWTTNQTDALLNTSINKYNSLFTGFKQIINDYNDVPIGTIMPWSGTGAIPTDYLECNGVEYPQSNYPDLFNAIGRTYGGQTGTLNTFRVPDLTKYFIIGATGTAGDYVVGKTGGNIANFTKTLTIDNLPSHTHTATSSSAGGHTHPLSGAGTTTSSGSHSHVVSGTALNAGSHAHGMDFNTYSVAGAWENSAYFFANPDIQRNTATKTQTTKPVTDHTHTVSGSTDTVGGHSHSLSGNTDSAGSHTHPITINSTGSGTAFDVTPPYMALRYIIKAKNSTTKLSNLNNLLTSDTTTLTNVALPSATGSTSYEYFDSFHPKVEYFVPEEKISNLPKEPFSMSREREKYKKFSYVGVL